MFARTDRLLLRPGWAEDAPALCAAIADEAIVRNLATAPWPYSMADAEAFLALERSPMEPNFLLFRRTRGAPQLVGSAGLGRSPGGQMELGYWIARAYWGLGYATEAAEAVLSFAHHGLRLRTVTAEHFTDNPASGRVLEKIGFKPTGQLAQRHSAGRGATATCELFRCDLTEGKEDAAQAAMSFEKAFCLAA